MREPVHPGRAFKIEIEARGVSATKLALALRVPSGRITAILAFLQPARYSEREIFSLTSVSWP